MIRLTMAGAAGRMGRRIMELAEAADDINLVAGVDIEAMDGKEIDIGGRTILLTADLAGALAGSDVMIDFTAPEACMQNAVVAHAAGKALVIGTTGFSQEQRATLAAYAQHIPIVLAPNMSVGVNLLFKLTAIVAETLGLDYNCEITEIHHNQKKDSPSGTAVRLGEIAADALGLDYQTATAHGREGLVGARPRREIGMHALRGGDVVGEHTVAFIGQGERVELTHKAHNRDGFAAGALTAARFVARMRNEGKNGLYDMQDVLGLR